MQMPEDLSSCLILSTIAASRALLRRFDEQLKPYGVTVQQFSLLAAIRYCPGEPVMALAQRIVLDRTSLIRNLNLLERKGLARRVKAAAGNMRLCELTDAGDVMLDRLLPEWQHAQSQLMEGITKQDADTYRRVAKLFAAE